MEEKQTLQEILRDIYGAGPEMKETLAALWRRILKILRQEDDK